MPTRLRHLREAQIMYGLWKLMEEQKLSFDIHPL